MESSVDDRSSSQCRDTVRGRGRVVGLGHLLHRLRCTVPTTLANVAKRHTEVQCSDAASPVASLQT